MSQPIILLLSLLILLLSTCTLSQIEPPPLPDIERCAFTNTHELRRNKNCMLYTETGSYKYCNQGDQLCRTKTERAFRPAENAGITPNQYCAEGFHPGENAGNNVRDMPDGRNTKRCFALANYGCSVPADVLPSTVCIDFGQSVNQKCADEPETPTDNTKVIVGLGGECGKKNTDNKDLTCGYNLYCNSNRVCAKASRMGEPCGATDTLTTTTCANGLTCVHKRCYLKYSIPFGQSCERNNNYACSTGFCNDASLCDSTLTLTDCTKDADCVPATTLNGNIQGGIHVTLANTLSVCLVDEPHEMGKKGTCSAWYQPAASEFEECLFRECQASEGEGGYNALCKQTISPNAGIYTGVVPAGHPCQKQWVRRMCAQYCVQQEDRRYVRNVPYTFDCDAQTATKWGGNDCSVTAQFKKCTAVRSYKSDASGLRGANVVLSVVLAIVVALFGVFNH